MLEDLKKSIMFWFETPDGSDERDDVWSDFHVFSGDWIELKNRLDRYESPNVPSIYSDHKYIFKANMGLGGPEETYYEQKIDNGEFASHMYASEKLPSGRGELKIKVEISADPPQGENDFCHVDYITRTLIRYDISNGIEFLPRILAYPLNRFFKWAFVKYIAEEMVERDGEYAIERTTEYSNYVRKYHGEEPLQTKTRQTEFKPMPEEGIFFQ